MKIAITGSNGFLGSHLVNAALTAGHDTIALIRKGANVSRLPESRKLSIESINFDNPLSISESIEELKKTYGTIDAFIHNAGLTVSSSREALLSSNTLLTDLLLSACKARNWLATQGQWLQISSYAANGPEESNGPVSAYGESKLAAEALVHDSGLPYKIFRPTAIYGSGDLAFLPLFKTAKYGIYPSLAPKKQRITMIHGHDLARFVISQVGDDHTSKIFHLSDGNTYFHQDLKEALQSSLGIRLKAFTLPQSLILGCLSVYEWLAKVTKQPPSMTVEKYREISGHWQLRNHPELLHPEIDTRYTLQEGFREAYNYYKSVNLL